MVLKRFLRKRRRFLKYAIVFCICMIVFYAWKVTTLEDTGPSEWPRFPQNPIFARFNINSAYLYNTGNYSPSVCTKQGHFELNDHADIYTYDLPDKTDYTLITGKRFKEYVIPVKSETVAYGPDLDPLTVLLIPFSHVDPGYGRTMEEYYNSHTKNTLNNMVKKLEQYKDITFQWAETVFLERWWRDIKPEVKESVRKLIERGQLEIVLGGWVMPDEASTHYLSVIDQLVEGHQWLTENLQTKPRNSWSNDPFGFSSTMPYLWKQTGMSNMVILRIHQAIKGTLMKKRAMEFTWKQLWSDREENGILCHLMAYRGYWIGDTCGPYNQHICREYAFMHTEPIHKVVFVTKANLEERARILYEQYRITAEIYRRHGLEEKKSGVRLFLPIYLGEDFSYTKEKDFDLIYTNYKMLFDYINSKPEWRMKIKFGTTAEYFNLIRDYQDKRGASDGSTFPSLAGDFFPYSDYQNDYWTGYYTTRPFNKQISRELQSLIRMADILHTYAFAYARSQSLQYDKFEPISVALKGARHELGMFLHHDGITGTSVLHVIQDFQRRLYNAVLETKHAIRDILAQLLTNGKEDSGDSFIEVAERKNNVALRTFAVFPLKSKGKLVIINPSSRTRTEVIRFLVSTPVKISKPESRESPVVQFGETVGGYEVSLRVKSLPFSIESYILEAVSKYQLDGRDFGSTSNDENMTVDKHIILENAYIRAEFSKETGMLVKLTDRSGIEKVVTFEMDILSYISARSGAYIFAPSGAASSYLIGKPTISLVRGNLKSSINVAYKGFSLTATLYNIGGVQGEGLYMTTVLDMKSIDCNNREVIMRFKTDIQSDESFFTDQNGFQMLGRKTYKDRPVEQNYYPLTAMAILEDSSRRLTLHAGQPHGAASLNSGWLEVMLDRCVSRDDNKGLGQGVRDNVPTEANFIIQIEKFPSQVKIKDVKYTHPSEKAILMQDLILHPMYPLFLVYPDTITENSKWRNYFRPISGSLPCTLEVASLRTLVKNDISYNTTSVILHKKAPLCLSRSEIYECDKAQKHVSIKTLFSELKIHNFNETFLTHLYNKAELSRNADITPKDMELRAFTVKF